MRGSSQDARGVTLTGRILTTWDWRAGRMSPCQWTIDDVVVVTVDVMDQPIGPSWLETHRALHRGTTLVMVHDRAELPGTVDMDVNFAVAFNGNIVPALGASTQEELDAGVALLFAVKAKMRTMVLEPREALDPSAAAWGLGRPRPSLEIQARQFDGSVARPLRAIDWVIVRGGSDPMHPAWVRAIRDQCADAAVPFAFLGWGKWTPGIKACLSDAACERRREIDAQVRYNYGPLRRKTGFHYAYNFGAEFSDRMLDGLEHLDSPWGPLTVAP